MKGKSSTLLLVGSVLLLVIFQSAKISSIVILDKPAYPTDDNCFSLFFFKKEKPWVSSLVTILGHHLDPHCPLFLFNRSLGRRVARSVLLVSAMVEVERQHLFSSLHKKY